MLPKAFAHQLYVLLSSAAFPCKPKPFTEHLLNRTHKKNKDQTVGGLGCTLWGKPPHNLFACDMAEVSTVVISRPLPKVTPSVMALDLRAFLKLYQGIEYRGLNN